MTEILCLSTSPYFPYPTRKQNVMNRLTDCRVIYIDPPVSLIAKYKDPSAKEKAKAYKNGGTEVLPHLRNYASPPVLPFANKKRFINKLNQKKLAEYYAGICRENGFGEDFLLWCYSPSSTDIIKPLAEALGISEEKLRSHTVYDCVDRHSAYPGLIDPEVVDKMEEELAAGCSTVFATAEGLWKRLSNFNNNCHLLPNGAAYEIFSQVQSLEKEDCGHPVFGFVGMLQECINYEFLEHLADVMPEAELRFIGRQLPGVDLTGLKAKSNVKFLGLLPQKELPAHIKDFDVCLNVFDSGLLSEDVSPLKFYEYLATGKPVVSTAAPAQVKDFADCVYIAETKAQFVEKCKEAMVETPDSPKRSERIRRAKLCSWDERVLEMRKILGI